MKTERRQKEVKALEIHLIRTNAVDGLYSGERRNVLRRLRVCKFEFANAAEKRYSTQTS